MSNAAESGDTHLTVTHLDSNRTGSPETMVPETAWKAVRKTQQI